MIPVCFCIRVGKGVSNFLKVLETSDQSLVLALRGRQHTVEHDAPEAGAYCDDPSVAVVRSISVHPSFGSTDRRITITFKQECNGVRTTTRTETDRAEVVGVRDGSMLYPVFGSIGSNVGRPRLLLPDDEVSLLSASGTTISRRLMMLELWAGSGIDLESHALGVFFFVVWPHVDVPLPESQPIWMVRAGFNAMDLCCFYWKTALPTRYRGLSVTFPTTGGATAGWDVGRTLEAIGFLETAYRMKYASLPQLLPDA